MKYEQQLGLSSADSQMFFAEYVIENFPTLKVRVKDLHKALEESNWEVSAALEKIVV
jgi:hypothetical protein